jgi:hypothetical protein
VSLAAPLAAQSVDDDVRCLLASNFFRRAEKNPAQQQVAAASSAFYLGRLDARISTQQLKTALLTQAKAMTAASVGPTMNGCAKHLAQKGLALQSLGGPAAKRAAPVKQK